MAESNTISKVKSGYMFRLCYYDGADYHNWDFPGTTHTPGGGGPILAIQPRLGGYHRTEKMGVKKKTIKIGSIMWTKEEFEFVQTKKQYIMVFARCNNYTNATVVWRKWDTSNFNNSENHPTTYNLSNFYSNGDKVYVSIDPSEDASFSPNVSGVEIRTFDIILEIVEN